MPNLFISRQQVHAWSDSMSDDVDSHQASLTRLLKEQRRLTKFIEENAESMQPATAGVSQYMTGVVVRMFDLAGGRLRSATWAQVREAAARVQGGINDVLPLDDGFVERARSVDRAQPHILDEALMALFEREQEEDEAELDMAECLKVYLMMWVACEVLDNNWKPPKNFEGEDSYEYVHIEPEKPAADETPEA